MARRPKPAASKVSASTAVRRATPRSKSKGRKLANLSIAAGDPLQPAGLSEYLAASGESARRAAPGPGDAAAKAARAAALKSAHARWHSKRAKPPK